MQSDRPSPSAADAAPQSLRSACRRLVERCAGDWGLSRRGMTLLMVLPCLLLLAGAGSALFGKQAYKWVVDEDAFAETMQVLLYAASLILSLVIVRREFRQSRRVAAGLFLFLALALAFMVGEELDWGQRIFGWQTSEQMLAINKQKATNLHNIHGVGATFKWVQMFAGAYGCLLPLALLRLERRGPVPALLRMIVPHISLVLYFAPMFVWRIFRNTIEVPRSIYFVVEEYNEVVELTMVLGAFLFLLYLVRRVTAPAAVSSPPTVAAGAA
jgi:hypothetical protein